MQEWLFPLLLVAVISFGLVLVPLPATLSKNRKGLLAGWVLKLLITLAFHWVYSVYYNDRSTGDTWKFFSDAKSLYACGGKTAENYFSILIGKDQVESPVYDCFQQASYWYNSEEISVINDTRSIIRVNFLLLPLSGGNYLFHLFFFSSISFAGMCIIYELLQKYYHQNPQLLNWIVAFGIPSIGFWTGGILKETLMLPIFAIMIQLVFNPKNSIKKIILFCLLALLLLQIKFYVGVTAILAMLVMLAYKQIERKKLNQKILNGIASVVILIIVMEMFAPRSLPQMMAKKQNAFINLARGGDYWTIHKGDTIFIPPNQNPYYAKEEVTYLKKGILYHSWKNLSIQDTLFSNNLMLDKCLARLKPAGSSFSIKPIEPTWIGLVKGLPGAFVNGLLRPFPNELNNAFMVLSFLENYTLLFCLSLIVLLSWKQKINIQANEVFILSFCLLLLSLIGLITPVTGALVRYRLPAIWLMALLCAMHWKQFNLLLRKKAK